MTNKIVSFVQKLRQFGYIGEFSVVVELHREGSAKQACLLLFVFVQVVKGFSILNAILYFRERVWHFWCVAVVSVVAVDKAIIVICFSFFHGNLIFYLLSCVWKFVIIF